MIFLKTKLEVTKMTNVGCRVWTEKTSLRCLFSLRESNNIYCQEINIGALDQYLYFPFTIMPNNNRYSCLYITSLCKEHYGEPLNDEITAVNITNFHFDSLLK